MDTVVNNSGPGTRRLDIFGIQRICSDYLYLFRDLYLSAAVNCLDNFPFFY